MTARLLCNAAAAAMLACALAGCARISDTANTTVDAIKGFVPSTDIQVHAVRSIKQVKVSRIAVMPLVADTGNPANTVAEGGAEATTAELYAQSAIAGGWDVVPEEDVESAMTTLPPGTPQDIDQNALKLGRGLSVDGVLYGVVERYREREGLDFAAQTPASVAFTLKFVDLQSKQIVWTAKFDKTQKALSQNIFQLANFVHHQGRWVRANEIAADGITQAVANLHGQFDFSQNVKRFETGTYGQLKSGQQRYTTGPQGMY